MVKRRSPTRVLTWKCNNCGHEVEVEELAIFAKPQDPPGTCPRCGVDDTWEPEECMTSCSHCLRAVYFDGGEDWVAAHECIRPKWMDRASVPKDDSPTIEFRAKYTGILISDTQAALIVEPIGPPYDKMRLMEVPQKISPAEARKFARDLRLGQEVKVTVDKKTWRATVDFGGPPDVLVTAAPAQSSKPTSTKKGSRLLGTDTHR